MRSVTRRDVLVSAAGLFTGAGSRLLSAQPQPAIVRVALNYPLGQYYFDPIGLFVPKGSLVRWQFPFRGGPGALMGCTITAFHPSNDNHELRIPESAKPFDSGALNKASGATIGFEWTFDVEGTYDYYSAAQEVLGMVGRIVVGTPSGPASKPPGYGGRDGRAVVYPAEAAILDACPAEQIIQKKTIPYPKDLVVRPYPFGER